MSGSDLVRYDAMCTAIAAAYAVDEVKDIRDKALALERYMRQAQNTEAERQACEIRLRAERKCGQLLREREMAKGGRPAENRSDDVTGFRREETLSDIGISKQQSSDWQRLADIPEPDFESALTVERPTTSGIIAAHAEPKPQMDDRALWLWGRLQDFERLNVLDADPNELIGEMFEHMQATTRELLPRVRAWLGRIQ